MSMPVYTVADGLTTFGPEAVAIFEALERRFVAWAADCGAASRLYPRLLRIERLSQLDYFINFPHLAAPVTRVRPERLDEGYGEGGGEVALVPSGDLTDSYFVLPSAACFSVYLDLEDETLEEPLYVTTVAHCFRNETSYEGLRRLWGFTMREIVCVGPPQAVKDHLAVFEESIAALASEIGIELRLETATDPFFRPASPRARLQKLFPNKKEFVYGDSVAIASLNFHRNFFGEKCRIRTADGEIAFSGCVAFGLERWLHALLDHFGGDGAAALRALDA